MDEIYQRFTDSTWRIEESKSSAFYYCKGWEMPKWLGGYVFFYQVFAGEWRNCVMGTGYKAKHRLPPPSEYRLSWETAAHMRTG